MKKREEKFPVLPLGMEEITTGMIQTDPFGSYTGRPADPLEKPVQDADDL